MIRIVILSVLLMLTITARATDNGYSFQHFSVEDGLSQSTVRAITQDCQGNIWFGTQNGLNRYNGYEFKTFYASISDSTKIDDSSINSLYADKEGNLWIGTSSGLSLFDFSLNRFFNYSIQGQRNNIYSITEDNGYLLLSSDNGLILFNKKTLSFETDKRFSGQHLRCLCKIDNGLLVGTDKGLFIYNNISTSLIEVFKNYGISSIVPVDDGSGYWIGTHGHGLFKTDQKLNITEHFSKNGEKHIMSDYIRVLKSDGYGRLWVGTYDGLSVYENITGTFSEYRHNENPNSLSHNSIWSIFIDNQDGVWIGTYFGGVNYYNSYSDRFSRIQLQQSDNNEIYGFVSCIKTDSRSGVIWAGTNDDGLIRYDHTTKELTRFGSACIKTANGIRTSDNIKCISEDGAGGLYVGTHLGGIFHIDIQTKRAEIYNINERYPINNGCYSILDEDDGTLWAGSNFGLFSFDKTKKTFSKHNINLLEPRLDNLLISYLFKDSSGAVWIGTNSGLYMADANRKTVFSFDNGKESPATDTYINYVMETSSREIWVGTNKGLFKYSNNKRSFKRFCTEDGLPNDDVFGILEDNNHILWMSTGSGICCLDPFHNEFKVYNNVYTNNEFTVKSCDKGRDGYFYFGGLKGITLFNPLEVSDNPYSPKPFISDISVFYNQIKPSGSYNVTRDKKGDLKNVIISSKDKIFSIEFSVSNPLSHGKNIFYYTLEGFDKQWFETSSREVSYSNLNPGQYVFKLKSSNNDGKICEGYASLPITIKPCWWQTSLAKTFFILLGIVIVLMIIIFITNRMSISLQLEMEKKDKERIKELGQEKINFFINLSHELRTPLTLILSPLNEIEEHGHVDDFEKKRLGFIRRSGMKLMHIVNQMLDYRKAEQGLAKLQIRNEDPDAIASECFSMFEEEAMKRDLDYIFDSDLGGIKYPIDKNVIEVILMNLISNAFKFTPESGLIKLSLKQKADYIEITVHDNGIGIDEDKLPHIFDLFYQIDETRSGSGIGLAIVKKLAELHHGQVTIESKKNSFTDISIKIPALLSSYSPEEFATVENAPRSSELENLPYFLADATRNALNDDENAQEEEDSHNLILIAIADSDFRKYIAESFTKSFRIKYAEDGTSALEMVKENEPDIIIADRNLIGVDGLKLCQNIKRNIQTCHIPVIILGTKDSVDEEKKNIEAGADAYLAQPFSIGLLQVKVANILKTRDRFRHRYSANTEIVPDQITSNSIDGDFLKRAIEVVEQNIDNESFSSNDFAEAMYMSRSNLYLKITSITGESAAQFIRKIRFNKACHLILEQKYSISEISTKVGFNSPSYFATSFKKYVGCLPTEYGKLNKNKILLDDLKSL